MTTENYKAGDIDEIVWLRLNRLRSVKLCEKLIRAKLVKNPNAAITEELIKSKAIGLSSAIESAIGYWQVRPQSVNAKVLSRYYFLLQMTIAEQVSSVKNTDDLKAVQRHTEYGHGLGTISDHSKEFPFNYYTFAVRGGHFYSYTKSLGVNTKDYDFEKRPRKFSDITEIDNAVSLIDLFRRIPELANVIEEYTDLPPLSFHVGHSEINMRNDLEAAKAHMAATGQFAMKAPEVHGEKTTYISFYSESDKITPEYLKSLNLGLTDFQVLDGTLPNEKFITGQLRHDSRTKWFDHLQTYRSSNAPTTIIAPLWGQISDNVVINFTLLYTLSIIVRYLPDLWYRISSGDLDHIGSLIEYYVAIADHTLPLQMLERITDAHISIQQPGSIFGSI